MIHNSIIKAFGSKIQINYIFIDQSKLYLRLTECVYIKQLAHPTETGQYNRDLADAN